MEPRPLFWPEGPEGSARAPPRQGPHVLQRAKLLDLGRWLPRWWVEWPVILGSESRWISITAWLLAWNPAHLGTFPWQPPPWAEPG